jgi:hypothetical protein
MHMVVIDDDNKVVYFGGESLGNCLFNVMNNGINRVRVVPFDSEHHMDEWIAMVEGKYRYSSQTLESVRWLVGLHNDIIAKCNPIVVEEEKELIPF